MPHLSRPYRMTNIAQQTQNKDKEPKNILAQNTKATYMGRVNTAQHKTAKLHQHPESERHHSAFGITVTNTNTCNPSAGSLLFQDIWEENFFSLVSTFHWSASVAKSLLSMLVSSKLSSVGVLWHLPPWLGHLKTASSLTKKKKLAYCSF